MEKQKVAVVGRLLLYRGSISAGPLMFFFHTKRVLLEGIFKIIQTKDCYHNISQGFGIDLKLPNCLEIKKK